MLQQLYQNPKKYGNEKQVSITNASKVPAPIACMLILIKLLDNKAKNGSEKNTEIKELQHIRLIGKTAAEIPHPPVKYHGDDIGNNAVSLCAQINAVNKF